jgi:hypothetical protein
MILRATQGFCKFAFLDQLRLITIALPDQAPYADLRIM